MTRALKDERRLIQTKDMTDAYKYERQICKVLWITGKFEMRRGQISLCFSISYFGGEKAMWEVQQSLKIRLWSWNLNSVGSINRDHSITVKLMTMRQLSAILVATINITSTLQPILHQSYCNIDSDSPTLRCFLCLFSFSHVRSYRMEG